MIIAIHQPNFLPWLGFFYKWSHSDIFVLLDDVQFSKGSIINRVKIKAPEGNRWLTVPVLCKGKHSQSIKDVQIDYKRHWQKKLLGSITSCYEKTRYFKNYFPELEAILLQKNECLFDLNVKLLSWLAEKYSISVPVRRSSEITGVIGASTERLVRICQLLGGNKYLSGQGGQKYQDISYFDRNQIQVIKTDFQHPVYCQLWGDFIPGVSALDLLMNHGNTQLMLKTQMIDSLK